MSAHDSLYEYVVTRDAKLNHSDGSWSSIIRPPYGFGWEIADSSRDRHTVWRRVRRAGRLSVQEVASARG